MVPNPIGILKRDGNENEINASNYFMGKKYALALSSSMKYLKTEKLNLRSNNLGSNGSIAIIENLSHVLTDLDLSKNKMGDEAMQNLVAWLEDMPNKCKLKCLNLSANKFSDMSLFKLGEALSIANPPLKLLDLSHNKLEQTACRSLGDYIRYEASELIILRLQWNRIHSDGAIYLFDAITNNTSVKNLDVSWNMLGTKNYKKNAEVMLKLANLVN
jgi:Ran GTPase-activating protein (RanGAP) involved in mRNA processing and transport